ncbi:MAG: leucine-rich repeat domain-containing protein [Clostridia bacterium]|nr:leucine-rich repeat domain-containing protein [Clostridia bacterium]
MKKSRIVLSLILVLLLVFVGSFVLTACGEKDGDNTQSDEQIDTPVTDGSDSLPSNPNEDDNQKEDLPGGEITPPQEPEEDVHTCLDNDNNHICDTCDKTLSICVDANNNHLCDICNLKLTNCLDSNNNHLCEICGATISECIDTNNNHLCDVCNAKLDNCVDSNNNHLCDKCNTKLTECINENTDHLCDICSKTVTACLDESKDHLCDICGTRLSSCIDDVKDHLCDICGEKVSECCDNDNNHICDICNTKIDNCIDSNNNHLCDKCNTILTECINENNDHLCDICGTAISNCIDNTNDHLCDICGETFSQCTDSNTDHNCDICNKELTICADNNNDHSCDVCGELLSVCVDENQDKLCDICKIDLEISSVQYLIIEPVLDENEEILYYSVNGVSGEPVNVIIPSTYKGKEIKAIGDGAFFDCDSLKSLVVPESITTLGYRAIENCNNLSSIKVSNNLEYLDYGNFKGCTQLEYTIKDNVKYIGSSTNPYCIAMGTISENATSLILDDNCIIINHDAFKEMGLCEEVYFGKSLKLIGTTAFSSCELLEEIVLPDNVETIYPMAFYNCSSLKKVYLGQSLEIIGGGAFEDCAKIIDIVIPSTVQTIYDSAFEGCTSLWEIGNYSNLDIEIGATTYGKIGYYAKNIYTETTGEELLKVDENGFAIYYGEQEVILVDYYGTNKILNIPEGVTTIKEKIFYTPWTDFGNTVIHEVILPDTVTTVGDYAFYICSNLTKVTIGKNVVSIGQNSFASNKLWEIYNKSNVSLPTSHPFCNVYTPTSGASKLTIINDCYIFDFKQADFEYKVALSYIGTSGEITLPNIDNLYIWSYFVQFDDSIKTLNLPKKSMTGDAIVYGCKNFEKINYLGTLEDFCTRVGAGTLYYDSDKKGYDLYLDGEKVVDLVIPNTISAINDNTFWGCKSIKTLYIPKNVTSIGEYAFKDCKNLESVTFEEGSQLTYIGRDAFAGNNKLTSIKIPNTITYLGNSALGSSDKFAYNEKDNVKYWGSEENPYLIAIGMIDKSMTMLTIADGCKIIYSEAFDNCDNLTSVVIPDSVTSIGDYAFSGCSNLTSVVIPDSVTSIGKSAFNGCVSLTSVTIGNNVTSIGESAFEYCRSLTSVTIGNNVTSIGVYAFELCYSLTSVYYEGTEEEWSGISIDDYGNGYLTNATRYYYSETEPVEEGNYWHYVDGVPTPW